jgi:hypothetical protein
MKTVVAVACGLAMLAQTTVGLVVVPAKGGVSFLGMNASQLNCKKKAKTEQVGPTGNPHGKNKCPCVGIDNIQGYFAAQIDYHHVQYPLEVGSACAAWDKDFNPACKAGVPPAWCQKSWCYVDPCNCDIEVTPKKTGIGLEYQGHAAFWSYSTCGNLDLFTADTATDNCNKKKDYGTCIQQAGCGWDGKQCLAQDSLATCESKKAADPAIYGKEDCRCVGMSGHQNGKAVMYINDHQQVAYHPSVGGTCGAWEQDAHPDCLRKAGAKPSFCSQKWCFVDPCKCSGVVPPKTVMEANSDMRFQGKTAYWSYATCGSVDEWSGNMKSQYCVTQTTETACTAHEKCVWHEGKCLGKAFVEICAKQKESGVLGVEVFEKSSAFATTPFVALLAMAGVAFAA